MAQSDVDEDTKEGLTADERSELVKLRRETCVQVTEIETLARPVPV